MTDYFVEKQEYGHTVRMLDTNAFAADLCKAMGGTMIGRDPAELPNSNERYADFALDGCKISVTRGWNHADRQKVSIAIYPLNESFKGYAPSGADYKLPSIMVSVTRPMDRLVADVKRRLIAPAAAPIAKRREYADSLVKQENNLTAIAARLGKVPGLRVKTNGTNDGTFDRYSSDRGYISGRFSASGTVTIDRLASINLDQFERIMVAIYGNNEPTKGD